MFQHADLTQSAERDKFSRSIARFVSLLLSPRSKLFVMFMIDRQMDQDIDMGKIAKLTNVLSRKTNNACLLVVRHVQVKGEQPSCEVESSQQANVGVKYMHERKMAILLQQRADFEFGYSQ
jgi:hypothetical protein